MKIRPTRFVVPSGAAEELLAALAARFATREETPPARVVTYHDTFDWRVRNDGGTLAVTEEGAGVYLDWRHDDGQPRHRLLVGTAPAFAWDLPEGALRDQLSAVIEMRRLFPLVRVEASRRMVRILDDEEKTVARVCFEAPRALLPGDGEPRPMAPSFDALPVRGYRGAFRRLLRFLVDETGLEQCSEDELEAALAVFDRRPRGYSAKLDFDLEPEMRADAAMKTIYRRLLATMEANEEGVKADLDSEFLHDFRVAVRRTRSALTQVKGVFPEEVLGRFKEELRWLGGITGPTRDLDVYLLKMPAYRARLSAASAGHLDELDSFLHQLQRREQRQLATALKSQRYRRLVSSWRQFLEEPLPERPTPVNATRGIRALAAERIERSWRRAMKLGRVIDRDTPAADVHRLRIACKKLRYLLEFFRTLFPEREMRQLIKALKQLQDNLGDFNDYELQQISLEGYAEEMAAAGKASGAALLAMGRLVDRLEKGQERERQRISKRFSRFAAKPNQELVQELFGASAAWRRGESVG